MSCMQDALSSERYSVIKDRRIRRSRSRLFGAGASTRDAIRFHDAPKSISRGSHRRSRLEARVELGGPGGAGRDRTDDLRLAKPALSQLSYSPREKSWSTDLAPIRPGTPRPGVRRLAKRGKNPNPASRAIRTERRNPDRWWAWVDSNHRPPAYQADALTGLSYRPFESRGLRTRASSPLRRAFRTTGRERTSTLRSPKTE